MKKKILLASIFATMMLTYACSKKEKNSDTSQTPSVSMMNGTMPSQDSFFVPQTDIVGVAAKYTEETFKKGIMNGETNRAINDVYPINDRLGKPAMYVINYASDGGTIIFSADYRFEPIIFFSTKGSLNITDTLPNSFHHTLTVFLNKIEALRYNPDSYKSNDENNRQRINSFEAWTHLNDISGKCCLHPTDVGLIPSYDPCAYFNYPPPYLIDQKITTAWGQSAPYNSQIEPLQSGCVPPVGCVAVAVAQIARYRNASILVQAPDATDLNYPIMPIMAGWGTAAGDEELFRLLDITYSQCKWFGGCNQTASNMNKAVDALNYPFNLTASTKDNGASSNSLATKARIVDQLEHDWPVILAGTTTQGNQLGFPSFGEAHSWLSDGYRHEKYCTYTVSYFHMNWGWQGLGNGWVLWNNWTPVNMNGALEYNSFLKLVYDIHE